MNLGIQTWTLRKLDLRGVVEYCVRHSLTHLQAMPGHIDPTASEREIIRKKELLDANGLICYAIGVTPTSAREKDNRKLFDGARVLGLDLIIIEPQDVRLFDPLEKLADEYDIRLAVHNHGLGTTYGNPEFLRRILRDHGPRIGVCLDSGWAANAGFDPVNVFRGYKGRVYDIHLKDMKLQRAGTRQEELDVPLGTGDANLEGLIAACAKSGYDGVLAIESDNDLPDPDIFIDEAIRFVRRQLTQHHG